MAGTDEDPPTPSPADRRLGEQLRRIRAQQGLSLHEVEDLSEGTIKASVLGAYERGERRLSLARLHHLADFYRVPTGELLPGPTPETTRGPIPGRSPRLVIDLVALDERREEEPVLARYVEGIRRLRGDHYGRVLTVRGDDVRTLAAIRGLDPEELRAQLAAAHLAR